jgi:hypothetical protein
VSKRLAFLPSRHQDDATIIRRDHPARDAAARCRKFWTANSRTPLDLRQLNQSIGRRYQAPRAHRQGSKDMGIEHAGPARGDQSHARPTARRSGELRWGPLFLLVFAGNLIVATLAWFLVGLFLK